MVTYVSPKNFFRLSILDSSQSKGSHAKKIITLSDEAGQAAQSSNPPAMAMKRLMYRFKSWFSE